MSQDTYDILQKVVDGMEGPENWSFQLVDEEGAKRLVVYIDTFSNYDRTMPFTISHWHPAPVATYNEKTWQSWVFDQCVRTMHHELGESIKFNGKRPFAPCHGPGFDPYTIHRNVTPEERKIMQDGSIRKVKAKSNDGSSNR